MLERPTRRAEALRYWTVMQAPATEMPFDDRKAELQMLAEHCQSDVLRDLCGFSMVRVGRRPVRQRLSEIRA
jgi:hypothetical protein